MIHILVKSAFEFCEPYKHALLLFLARLPCRSDCILSACTTATTAVAISSVEWLVSLASLLSLSFLKSTFLARNRLRELDGCHQQ